MAIFNVNTLALEEIQHVMDYHKYWLYDEDGGREKNPHADHVTKHFLNLKNPAEKSHQKSIDFFSERLTGFLAEQNLMPDGLHCLVVTVPSHREGAWSDGLGSLVKQVCAKSRLFVPRPKLLLRLQTIDKLASGGNRQPQVHLDSIVVNPLYVDEVRKKHVLLLDDITTTGHSLEACAQVLYQSGAGQVTCVALGKTV